MTKNEILEIARQDGYSTIEITYGTNGYPQHLGDYGVIGFENFDAAQQFAEQYGGEVAHFTSRDGWHFWNTTGRAWGPYTVYDMLKDMGDNYSIASNEFEVYAEQLAEVARRFDGDFSELKAVMNNIEEIILAIDNKDDDEAVITNCGNYYDTVKMETMQYSYDTHRYAIGVLVRNEE